MIDFLFPTAVMHNQNVLEKPHSVLGAIGTDRYSSPDLQEKKEFNDLVKAIMNYSNEYADIMNWDCKLYVQSMWSNVMRSGQDHPPHTHANSLLSGVYYPPGATPTMPAIEFFDSRNMGGVLPTNKGFTIENSSKWAYPVIPNSLLLFPAWLQHWVPVNKSLHPRISISFNIMITGRAGKDNDLCGITWK